MSDFSSGFGNGLAKSAGMRELFGGFITAPAKMELARQRGALYGAQTGKASEEAIKAANMNALFDEYAQAYRNAKDETERGQAMVMRQGAYNTNAPQAADAFQKLRESEYFRRMAEGTPDDAGNLLSRDVVAGAKAAIEGKPMYDNVNNTGVSINKYTGKQDTSHPGLYGLFGDKTGSEIAENRAQAGNASASAARTRQAMGHEKLNIRAIETPDGQQLVNVNRDGTYTPITNRETGQAAVPGYRPQGGRGNRRPGSLRSQPSQQPAMSQQDFDVFANDVRAKLARGDITREQARDFLMQARGGQ